MTNKPKALTKSEWDEIDQIEEVRELWGIGVDDDAGNLRREVCAAKFHYQSDCPGYAGDLIVLLGGAPECPPTVIIRQESGLQVVGSSEKWPAK